MHDDNVRVFERAVDAINRLESEAVEQVAHPEAVFEPLRAATEGAFVGREGVRRFIADTAETFDLFVASYTEFHDLGGDRFIATGSIRMRGRQSGVESEVPTAAIVELRDGLLWRYKDYGEVRFALAAVAG